MRSITVCSWKPPITSSQQVLPSIALKICSVSCAERLAERFCENCERLLIHDSSLTRLSAVHDVTDQKVTQLLEAPGGVQER
ncbi:hypothetical protein KEM48_011224 [Puccinia striiformis f. sp. tritici PST-130]|nr:hypothetical protein KEM48_011224 [Puccinia striiformis f. sp. tritici PST-130]